MIEWDKAPDWAKFKATDTNGWMYWFEHKPTPTFSGWHSEGQVQLCGRLDWQKTLKERPVD